MRIVLMILNHFFTFHVNFLLVLVVIFVVYFIWRIVRTIIVGEHSSFTSFLDSVVDSAT